MKRILVILIAFCVLFTMLLPGCQSPFKGSGELDTQELNFTDFSNILIDGPMEVNVSYADSTRVTVTTDENVFEKMTISQEDQTLKIELQRSRFLGIIRTQYVDVTVKVAITMPHLRSLSLSGAAEGTLSGFDSRAGITLDVSGTSSLEIEDIFTGDVNLSVSDASEVTGGITAGDAQFTIKDASTADIDGSASNMVCQVKGGSQLTLEDFAVDNADMHLGSASKSVIRLKGKLDVNLSGASDLIYCGNPVMGNTKISGGSTLSRKENPGGEETP